MQKAYEPKKYEDDIYAAWESSGLFNPDNLPGDRKTPYVISLPPPNATGTLHLGHAMYTVQDILIRFERLRGKAALWLPGTDHAAIATNAKVERMLDKEEGKTRHDIGREAFEKKVHEFVANNQGVINNQLRKMGFSLDWSRESYTLDEHNKRAVREAFKRMYDDELIYQGIRVINWDPVAQSTISDDEVVHKEGEAQFYTFRYSKDFPIPIATTRPETKVGDTAVAVHPNDKRYKKYIDQEFDVEFAGAKLHIKVIGDEEVDPELGTGALGVTPAHSQTDYEMSLRHGVPVVQVIDKDANMTNDAGSLVAGKTALDARKEIVKWLKKKKLLEKEETIAQNLSVSERTGAPIEPLPMKQWFIDVNKSFNFRQSDHHPIKGMTDGQEISLKDLMLHVVKEGEIKIIPNRFEKVYFNWIENLRDWNISRQIWVGHRVPVWYKGKEMHVGDAPKGKDWEQDPDTLDTWFSTGLWTFSTLGWPDETSDMKRFHPTDVLETGYDIIFFWVARMILMTTYLLGEVPFRNVYMHGLVRDEEGRKMSKSLENIIDPLDVSEKFGTDAVRLALTIGSTPGQDKNLSEQKIEAYRNFANKLWNISRFVLSSVGEVKVVPEPTAITLADNWILSRLEETTKSVTKNLEKFELSAAAEELRAFTWDDFADWYLEIAKIEGNKDAILLYVLERLLTMWHPFIPYVTEAIWKSFNEDHFLMVHEWPVAGKIENRKLKTEEFKQMQDVVVAIRNLRAENKVEPKKFVNVTLLGKVSELEAQADIIKGLARVEELVFDGDKPENAAGTVIGTTEVYLSLEGLVDAGAEKARLKKELAEAEKYLKGLKAKLDNKEFVKKAPKEVVKDIKEKSSEAKARIKKIKAQIGALA